MPGYPVKYGGTESNEKQGSEIYSVRIWNFKVLSSFYIAAVLSFPESIHVLAIDYVLDFASCICQSTQEHTRMKIHTSTVLL